jgi:hypothetical protein
MVSLTSDKMAHPVSPSGRRHLDGTPLASIIPAKTIKRAAKSRHVVGILGFIRNFDTIFSVHDLWGNEALCRSKPQIRLIMQ